MVEMSTSSQRRSGMAARNRSMTQAVCARASRLPRVPMYAIAGRALLEAEASHDGATGGVVGLAERRRRAVEQLVGDAHPEGAHAVFDAGPRLVGQVEARQGPADLVG